MTPRVVFLQHSDLDVPGLLGRLCREAGWDTRACRADLGESALPAVGTFDVLVVLGSGESVLDSSVPWIRPERELVADTVGAGVAVLGVCFGGQLLAQVLGGEVTRAADPEIGWREVGSLDPARIPPGPWLEWHEDAFSAPPGAEVLARNEASLQAYVAGIHTGVQFHPEVTRGIVSRWVDDALERDRLLPHQGTELLEGFEAGGSGIETRTTALWDAYLQRAGYRR